MNDDNFQNITLREKYKNIENIYLNYLNEAEKSNFSKSQAKFQIELNFLKRMYKIAKDENWVSEIANIQNRYDILSDNFKNYHGIIIKKINEI